MEQFKAYMGVDYHKKYSFVTVIDETGKRLWAGRLPNDTKCFSSLLNTFPYPIQAVLEASRTSWVMYDLLTHLNLKVLVAHPLRLRAIAQAQIKTDMRDSDILAQLLRAKLIPTVHVPDLKTRHLRNIMRQRLSLVRTRTQLKNRIHQLLDRNHIPNPNFSDLFGKAGRRYLDSLKLPESEDFLFSELLAHLDFLESQLKQIDGKLKNALKEHPYTHRLSSIPGIGDILASLIALEIDKIERFPSADDLASYVGLVPSTHASGGFLRHGPLLKGCNRLLKWAFVEAAWRAQASSAYCRMYYQRIRRRLGPNPAVCALARRLVHIAYALLKEQRFYEERVYCPGRPLQPLAH